MIDADAVPIAAIADPVAATPVAAFRDAVVAQALDDASIAGVLFATRWGGGGVMLT